MTSPGSGTSGAIPASDSVTDWSSALLAIRALSAEAVRGSGMSAAESNAWRRELEQHLEDAVQCALDRGLRFTAAWSAARRAFGDPVAVRARFARELWIREVVGAVRVSGWKRTALGAVTAVVGVTRAWWAIGDGDAPYAAAFGAMGFVILGIVLARVAVAAGRHWCVAFLHGGEEAHRGGSP